MMSLRTVTASLAKMAVTPVASVGGSLSTLPTIKSLVTPSTLWRSVSTVKTCRNPVIPVQLLCMKSPTAQNSLLQSMLRSIAAIPSVQHQRGFHVLSQVPKKTLLPLTDKTLKGQETTRSVVKFSRKKGRRKTVQSLLRRFYRLDWGIWIHAKSGRNRHLWKKGKLQKKRGRHHVFCNAWHTRTLERMTTKYWHKKKHWVDDPYGPYHTRPDFWITKNTKNIVHQLD